MKEIEGTWAGFYGDLYVVIPREGVERMLMFIIVCPVTACS